MHPKAIELKEWPVFDLKSDPTFRRGEVEAVLWHHFVPLGTSRQNDPPSVFVTRIKKLAEQDRAAEKAGGEEAGIWAFHDHPAEGIGRDYPFRPFNVFCLAVGLDLLDSGLKPSDVVFLLRHIRPDLQEKYEMALASPPSTSRQALLPADRPQSPSISIRGRVRADCTLFMTLQKVEIREVYSGLNAAPITMPILMEPKYYRGHKKLQEGLLYMPEHFRKVLIIELAYTAASVTTRLLEHWRRRQQPRIRRGS